jgi:glycosyltransferase involved in cell wall biosynthesis
MSKSQNQDSLRVLLAHPGTQHAPRLAAELHRRGFLQGFWSGFAFGDDAAWLRAVPAKMRAKLGGRICRGVPDRMIRCRPLLEWRALRRMARGERGEEVFHDRNERFQKSIPVDSLARSRAVVGFDTSSWILAERCRAAGLPFILEQTVAHPLHKQSMMEEASRRFPAWAEREEPRPGYLLAAERTEHELADRIVAGSSYCRRTLVEQGVSPQKIVVNPYGVERPAEDFVPRSDVGHRPLRFLFLGFLSLRKGLPLLLEAWEKAGLRDAELALAGGIRPEHRHFLPQNDTVHYAGFVPRSSLPSFLAQQDVNVLPSYSEGFAISLIEAMAAGLPIMATEHTGAPDIISPGREGFVLPVGDLDALVERLRWFSENRDKIPAMSAAAKKKSQEFTWERYGEKYEAMLHELGS